MSERIFAIGDVHGCHQALLGVLDSIAVSPTDTLVFLGDVIDRGPASKQVVDEILRLQNVCQVKSIMGNHEEMMRNALLGREQKFWLGEGGKQTLDSYGCSMDAIPPEHIRWLLATIPFWETETEIFVHANLESEVALPNQTSDFL
ncbi:MAG: serine/threonine protein phosphatase, partial [Planctomycetaceae bacterium]|nr:serine/threonine protein phosphatase [Planctomycetaceae bacterium]